jgi:hypothetical protein
MVEWLKTTDCKSVSVSFVGSNPTFFNKKFRLCCIIENIKDFMRKSEYPS